MVPEAGEAVLARIVAVRAEVAAAAARTGRSAEAVRIVAVTKTLPPTAVELAVAAGLEDIGENYVQEAAAKRSACRVSARWHLIGSLQRNKARLAVRIFDRIHSLDSMPLAAALSRAALETGWRVPVLVQVNVTGSMTQRGVPPEQVRDLLEVVVKEPGLAVDGLMAIGPAGRPPEMVRACFRAVRQLRDDVSKWLGVELPHLSMGMSDDFLLAVEEGATFVRLGRVLFGPRASGSWREGS